jgi:hypothetical protein
VTDHWFDRVAVRLTRRQSLKLALAGALAVPLARAGSAPAAERCTQPCFYTAQIHSSQRFDTCDTARAFGRFQTATAVIISGGLAGVISLSNGVRDMSCYERARLAHKADQFDCLQAGCGGFTPDPNVLCPGCTEAGGKCCPAPSSGTLGGYLCCPCCADNGDGCKAC